MIASHIQIGGKWVLAGEHTVIRGGEAVVFPASEFQLRLDTRTQKAEESDRECLDSWGGLSPVVARARDWLKEKGAPGAPLPVLQSLQSHIPQGAGLGSSAALCVAIARAFGVSRVPFQSSRERELGTHLENYFHGKSSGMDVAAVSFAHPLLFQKDQDPRPLSCPARFQFQLIDSGLRSQTRECIKKVNKRVSPESVDRMRNASRLAREGLEQENADKIVKSMWESTAAYREWGLLNEELEAKMAAIRAAGALGVRLTGSGLGGYFVAFQISG